MFTDFKNCISKMIFGRNSAFQWTTHFPGYFLFIVTFHLTVFENLCWLIEILQNFMKLNYKKKCISCAMFYEASWKQSVFYQCWLHIRLFGKSMQRGKVCELWCQALHILCSSCFFSCSECPVIIVELSIYLVVWVFLIMLWKYVIEYIWICNAYLFLKDPLSLWKSPLYLLKRS